MKTSSRLLILVFVLITACSDNEPGNPSPRELLTAHDWIMFSFDRGGVIAEPEPDPTYVVLSFNEAGLAGSDFTGEFYDLGDWTLEGEVLTMDGDSYQIIELTNTKLIYETPGEAIVTRLAVEKVARN